jgi:hypothetical protein
MERGEDARCCDNGLHGVMDTRSVFVISMVQLGERRDFGLGGRMLVMRNKLCF